MVGEDPPGCWLYQFGSFADAFLPLGTVESETNIFPFPVLSEGQPLGVIGGADMIAAFADRPEVRRVVQFLLSPTFGVEWAKNGTGFLSPNQQFGLENYQPFWKRQAEALYAALAADTFRFDASDLMPSPIGDDLFWDAMMTYAREGPESLDRILAELDAAWPDDG
jgi:alpha-glucoside transport system substrate-binding protein